VSDERVANALRQLEALKRGYAGNTRTVLDTLAARIEGSEDFAALLPEVESQLHKLAGSGGTFGYPELSRHARTLELSVRRQREQGEPLLAASELAGRLRGLVTHLALPATSGGPATDGAAAPLSQGTLLLLEPNAQEAQRLTATLLQFGHSVDTVVDAGALGEALQRQRPQAMLVDIDSLGADAAGIAATLADLGALRDQLGLHDSALLVISREDSFALRLEAARAGAQGFHVKPVDPMQVIDRLERLRQREQAPRFRVMLVDDDRLLASHHAAVLESGGFEVEVVTSPHRALERMAQFRPDLLLFDLYMPECSGPELARVVRMQDDWLATPIVFLSAETDMALQLSAASEGADDFLTKPIRDAHLIAAVRTRCERARQMATLINRDSLTGLLKHARIKEELLAEVSRAQRLGTPLSVAMLDIDHFKRVNDRYGHPVGDQVIRALSNLLRQRVRSTDRVGRYGGEEFMLVLPNCDSACARRLLEDIRERFKALLFQASGDQFAVTISAGIACFPREATAAELLARADQALYAAKRNGRDRVEDGVGNGAS
jgi:diguanylate cyclase (GGDEF)-like protein